MYTSTLLMDILAFGVRGDMISVNAIKAATANATVVKKPKTFCARTTVECIDTLGPDKYFAETKDCDGMEEEVRTAGLFLWSGVGSLALVVVLIPC